MSDYYSADERTAIKRAAKLMDKARPKWYRRIVFKRLNMSDACNCIAGQAGLNWEAMQDEYVNKYPDTAWVIAPFASATAEPLWIDEVRARRARAKS